MVDGSIFVNQMSADELPIISHFPTQAADKLTGTHLEAADDLAVTQSELLIILCSPTQELPINLLRLGGPSAKACLGGGSLDHLMEAKH